MTNMPTARGIVAAKTWSGQAERVILTYEERFLRRKVLITEDGLRFLVDLEKTTSLNKGDAFVLQDGRFVEIQPAAEPLLAITGQDMVRIAWHIGNRHTPCQIERDRLLIQRDHVIADMLTYVGAQSVEVVEPFTPEGGAYGHGRTHGHDHSHAHGPDHSHAEPHGHGHDADHHH